MPCPALDELEQFADGQLEGDSHCTIKAHVATCADCVTRLAEVADNLRMAATIQQLRQSTVRSAAMPSQIDGYRILREIGRGGMGVVYEARQDRPRRKVALKLIKPELTSPHILRRFEHEADILGRLKHPGIAQVYDAGTAATELGPQPYFAMELVTGVGLRTYVRTQRDDIDSETNDRKHHDRVPALGTRQTLIMMAEVCDAVHHAHQKGVIHRDLNPNNILIDHTGHPKVLDFGVARLTDAELPTTPQTEFGQLLGTIPYMSPEQAAGDPHHLDTRCDIYSLGVITYELLSGNLPYPLNRQLMTESLRVICEVEAQPLGMTDRSYRGDIETIVDKALQKDKAQRYASAAELAADIRRHLADEPILARPPTTTYQVRKFARRHRPLVWGVATVLVTLIAGTGISCWQAWQATRARSAANVNAERAIREAAKFKAVNEFLRDTFGSANPENSPAHPDMTVREALRRAVEKIDGGSLASQPEIETSVRTVIGDTYRGLADYAAAGRQLQTAVDLGWTTNPEGSEDLALALNKLGRLWEEQGLFDEAETVLRQALEMRRAALGDDHPEVADVMNNLGLVLQGKGQHDEAQQMYHAAIQMRRRLSGDQDSELASTLNNLAVQMSNELRFAEAEALFRESLAIDRKMRGNVHPNVAATMYNLSFALGAQGKLEEAEALARDAIDLQRRIFGDDHPHIATSLNSLALLVQKRGDAAEAERLFLKSLELDRATRGPRHTRVATTLNNLAKLWVKQQRFDEAEGLYREALSIQREVHGEQHHLTLRSMFSLAKLHFEQKKYIESESLFAEAARCSQPAEDFLTGLILSGHGQCLTRLERFDQAESALLKAHSILTKTFDDSHKWTLSAAQSLVHLYDAWEKPDAAEKWRTRLPRDEASSLPIIEPKS